MRGLSHAEAQAEAQREFSGQQAGLSVDRSADRLMQEARRICTVHAEAQAATAQRQRHDPSPEAQQADLDRITQTYISEQGMDRADAQAQAARDLQQRIASETSGIETSTRNTSGR